MGCDARPSPVRCCSDVAAIPPDCYLFVIVPAIARETACAGSSIALISELVINIFVMDVSRIY